MRVQPNEFEIVEGEMVQWIGNDGGLKTGRVMYTIYHGRRVTMSECAADAYYTQCRYSQGGEQVLVRSSLIKPYPSEPIPEPSK